MVIPWALFNGQAWRDLVGQAETETETEVAQQEPEGQPQ
jgi:hypothetical protein